MSNLANLDWALLDCMNSDHYFPTWNPSLNGINAKELSVTNSLGEQRNLDYKEEYVCTSKR